jgi:hypothetical protein
MFRDHEYPALTHALRGFGHIGHQGAAKMATLREEDSF